MTGWKLKDVTYVNSLAVLFVIEAQVFSKLYDNPPIYHIMKLGLLAHILAQLVTIIFTNLLLQNWWILSRVTRPQSFSWRYDYFKVVKCSGGCLRYTSCTEGAVNIFAECLQNCHIFHIPWNIMIKNMKCPPYWINALYHEWRHQSQRSH